MTVWLAVTPTTRSDRRGPPAVRGASSSESAQWVAPPRPRIRRGRDLACARVRLSAPARRKQCDDLAPGRRPTLRSAQNLLYLR